MSKAAKITPMDIADVPISELSPDPRNARKGDVAAISESLSEFGQHRPIVAQRSTKRIIAGNHLYKAALALGWDTVRVYWVDDDDKTAQRRSLADNGAGDKAEWDQEQLAALLAETGVVPGFDQGDVDKLIDKFAAEDEEAGPIFPIVAKVNEKYDYVLVVAQTAIDSAWLREHFDLRPERSYKNDSVATSQVVTVERVQELWQNG